MRYLIFHKIVKKKTLKKRIRSLQLSFILIRIGLPKHPRHSRKSHQPTFAWVTRIKEHTMIRRVESQETVNHPQSVEVAADTNHRISNKISTQRKYLICSLVVVSSNSQAKDGNNIPRGKHIVLSSSRGPVEMKKKCLLALSLGSLAPFSSSSSYHSWLPSPHQMKQVVATMPKVILRIISSPFSRVIPSHIRWYLRIWIRFTLLTNTRSMISKE